MDGVLHHREGRARERDTDIELGNADAKATFSTYADVAGRGQDTAAGDGMSVDGGYDRKRKLEQVEEGLVELFHRRRACLPGCWEGPLVEAGGRGFHAIAGKNDRLGFGFEGMVELGTKGVEQGLVDGVGFPVLQTDHSDLRSRL